MIRMLGHLTLSQRSLRLSSFLLILFFLSVSFISTILSSTSLILFSASVILLLVPSSVFLSHLLYYSLYIDFFISSKSLLNISCIFLIFVSRLFICNSILFSRFWIIFIIIIQNSLSGRFPISFSFFGLVDIYPVPLPAGYFSAFSSCLYCCLGWLFCILAVGGSSLLWRFLSVGGVGWVSCQGFLVRGTCVGVLVDGAGFPFSGEH